MKLNVPSNFFIPRRSLVRFSSNNSVLINVFASMIDRIIDRNVRRILRLNDKHSVFSQFLVYFVVVEGKHF